MIIILCESFLDARDAFDIFVSFLERVAVFNIVEVDTYQLAIYTDDDLRYIFMDYRTYDIFESELKTDDVTTIEHFFEGLCEYYGFSDYSDFM